MEKIIIKSKAFWLNFLNKNQTKMDKLESIAPKVIKVAKYLLPLLSIVVLVCDHGGVRAGLLLFMKEVLERIVDFLKDHNNEYEEAKSEFMEYFLKGRIPPSKTLRKLKMNDVWIYLRLYAVPEGKAKHLNKGGMFYDYNKCKDCFTGTYEENDSKEENQNKFQFSNQSFDTFHTKHKKNLLKTVEAMEQFIDEGGNRNKPRRKKRSKTPKRKKP